MERFRCPRAATRPPRLARSRQPPAADPERRPQQICLDAARLSVSGHWPLRQTAGHSQRQRTDFYRQAVQNSAAPGRDSPATQRPRLPLAERPHRAAVWYAEKQAGPLADTRPRTTARRAEPVQQDGEARHGGRKRRNFREKRQPVHAENRPAVGWNAKSAGLEEENSPPRRRGRLIGQVDGTPLVTRGMSIGQLDGTLSL